MTTLRSREVADNTGFSRCRPSPKRTPTSLRRTPSLTPSIGTVLFEGVRPPNLAVFPRFLGLVCLRSLVLLHSVRAFVRACGMTSPVASRRPCPSLPPVGYCRAAIPSPHPFLARPSERDRRLSPSKEVDINVRRVYPCIYTKHLYNKDCGTKSGSKKGEV